MEENMLTQIHPLRPFKSSFVEGKHAGVRPLQLNH